MLLLSTPLPLVRFFRHAVVQHTLFWMGGAAVIGLGLLASYDGRGVDPRILVLRTVWHLLCIGLAVYVNLRVLIPRFFVSKQYGRYGGLLVLSLAASAGTIMGGYLLVRGLAPDVALLQSFRPHVFLVFFIHAAILVLAATMLHFVRAWVQLKDQALTRKELERQKLEAELLALRAQLNPHFLFNTLNNIYALTLDGSERASPYILKLSELMRYILYDCRGKDVSLEKEVAFINNYVEMERLRLTAKADVRVQVVGQVDGERVAPLLFVPLIENAFKHGINSRLGKAFVHILMRLGDDGDLFFRIENDRDDLPDDPDDHYRGVGLANIRRRLALLYPGRHQLTIDAEPELYRVELTLELS